MPPSRPLPRVKRRRRKLGEIVSSRPFAEYITPERAMELHNSIKGNERHPLSYWQRLAKINDYCSICQAEPVWRWGQCEDMCFNCVTGESDPGDDYELLWIP